MHATLSRVAHQTPAWLDQREHHRGRRRSATTVTMAKSVLSGIVLKKPAAQPASLLPTEFERNQTPIIRPTMRTGASLVTALRPTGLRHSSPQLRDEVGRPSATSG